MNKPNVILRGEATVGQVMAALTSNLNVSGFPHDALLCSVNKAKSLAEILSDRLDDTAGVHEQNLVYALIDNLGFVEQLLLATCAEFDKLLAAPETANDRAR